MKKTGVLTQALAVIGTALVWLPITATVALFVAGSLASRMFRFDYLCPRSSSRLLLPAGDCVCAPHYGRARHGDSSAGGGWG